MKRITIKDVSKQSGFSISTVSRVINDNYPVKKETKDRIIKTIKDLNFNINSAARNLRTKKSGLVALVVPDINNSYYSKIAKLVDDELFDSGYNLLVCNTDESIAKEDRVLQVLIEKDVDVVAISSATNSMDQIRKLIDNGIKVVLLDRNIDEQLPFVGSPNFDEAKKLTNYLISMNHKKILFVAGTEEAQTSKERFAGFRAALEDEKIAFTDDGIIRAAYNKEEAYMKAQVFLKKNIHSSNQYTAIFSANNLMTIGIIGATQSLGLRIPEDISVVSFGALESQEIIHPIVTCINQDVRQIAIKTRQKIIDLAEDLKIDGEDSYVPSKLQLGESVKNLGY